VAEGWDIEDTGGKGARGPLPAEAIEVERIVGLFDSERGSGTLWTLEEFNEFAPRALSSEEILKVRALRAKLFQEWHATPRGQSLELKFEPICAAATSRNR